MADFKEPSGLNFHLRDDIPAQLLSQALCRIAAFFQNIEPHGVRLQQYNDWWEQDGLHFHKTTISFHDLFSMLQAPRALLGAMPGDDFVFVGIAPDNGSWYLRFLLDWDADDANLVGRFDLTVRADFADRLRARMKDFQGLLLIEQDASSYYASIRC